MRIQPIILGMGIIASIWLAVDTPMVRDIQGVVIDCNSDGLFGDGCQRDPGAMAIRFVKGMAATLVLAVAGGLIRKKKDLDPPA